MAEDNFQHLVRVANTDLDGNKYPVLALQKIKGVGWRLANAICSLAGVSKTKKMGYVDASKVSKLDTIVKDPLNNGIPTWMINRRRDYETGEDKHLIGGDLKFQHENDLKRLKKIKSYRGLRHQIGLTVRGQRTQGNFRRRRGKGGLGVKRKK